MKLKIKSINKTVAATGTPEQLSKDPIITSNAKIKALTTNTGNVFIGDSAAQDYPLAPGSELLLTDLFSKSGVDEIDLAEVYCKVSTNGNGVAIIYGAKK